MPTDRLWFGWTRRGIVRYLAQPHWREWQEIILHHTWKPTVADFGRNPNGGYWMSVIDRFHRMKGWKKIGYHFVVMPDGLIFVGRSLNEAGAHTVGHNKKAIGVCLLGNFDEEGIPEEQWASMKYLIAFLMHRFHLHPTDLYFHRQFAQKTCPGSKLDLGTIRTVIATTLPDAEQRYEEILKEGQS